MINKLYVTFHYEVFCNSKTEWGLDLCFDSASYLRETDLIAHSNSETQFDG